MGLRLEVLAEGMLLPGGSGGRAGGGAGAAAGAGLVCAAPTGALPRVRAAGAGAGVGVRHSAVVPVGRGPPQPRQAEGWGGLRVSAGGRWGQRQNPPSERGAGQGLGKGCRCQTRGTALARKWPKLTPLDSSHRCTCAPVCARVFAPRKRPRDGGRGGAGAAVVPGGSVPGRAPEPSVLQREKQLPGQVCFKWMPWRRVIETSEFS